MNQFDNFAYPPRTASPAPFIAWHHTLPSLVADIDSYVNTLMRFIRSFAQKFSGVEDPEIDIETALREAVVNAIVHRNREDRHKYVYVTCRCSIDGEITISVQDEGCGFDTHVLLDPTDPKNRLLSHGRGIYIMRALMDEVSFEANGRRVCMRRTLPPNPRKYLALASYSISPCQAGSCRRDSYQERRNCDELMALAEHELGAFLYVVTELFGPDEARLAAKDWIEHLESMETAPEPNSRDWRQITISASVRLAARVTVVPYTKIVADNVVQGSSSNELPYGRCIGTNLR